MSTVTMCNSCLVYKLDEEILDSGCCKNCYDNYKEINKFTNNRLASQKCLNSR
ncbi:hypothetical protein ACEE21_15355 [Clostridium baratii]